MPSNPPGVTAILQAVDRRGDTDERPSYFVHVVLPVLLALIGVLGAVAIVVATVGLQGGIAGALNTASATIVGGAVLLAVAGILSALVLVVIGLYRILRRHDRHFQRDGLLRDGLIDYARWLAARNPDTRADEHVAAMERIDADARLEEPKRSPAVHLILTYLIPLWILHIVWYLTKDFARHASNQERFLREFRALADEVGREVPEPEGGAAVQDRSFLLSLALLIPPIGLVGGFVVLYWLYDDPEQHFDRQLHAEDGIVELVSDEESPEGAGLLGEETTAPDEPDQAGEAHREPGQESQSPEPSEETEDSDLAPGGEAEEDEPAPEPEFTVWSCPECDKKYKVPPKRPVRVTCKNCEHKEILEE